MRSICEEEICAHAGVLEFVIRVTHILIPLIEHKEFCQHVHIHMLMYLLISPLADVDDMHICYVLRNGDNATSDSFHFSLEDNGKHFSNDD